MTDQALPPRARTRAAPIQAQAAPATSRTPPAAPTDDSWMHRGAVAEQARVRVAQEAEARREQSFKPWRLWLPPNTQADIIILDNVLGPSFYEHALPNPQNGGKRTLFELCPKEYGDCPLCASDKDSSYIMFLSVLDLRVIPAKEGRPAIPYTKKVLAVKHQLQPFFVRQLERHNGNFRGLHLLMTRDGPQSYAIGTPEYHAFHDEAALAENFNNPERRTQDGSRVIKEAGSDLLPFNYGEMFTQPSSEDLRRRYGGVAPAGSPAEVENAGWGGHDPAPAPAMQPVALGGQHAVQQTAIQPAATPAPVAQPQSGGITRAATALVAPTAQAQAPDIDDAIVF